MTDDSGAQTPPKRITGSQGTDPQPGDPGTAAHPTDDSTSGRKGVLRIEGGKAYVDVAGERISLDRVSTVRILGNQPARAAAPRTRREAPPSLVRAIETIRQSGATLASLPGVVKVRAGYFFADGRITNLPCVVVELDPTANQPDLPSELNKLPVQTTVADPYEQLARRNKTGVEAGAPTPRPQLLIDELQEVDTSEEEMARTISYQPPTGASLPEIQAAMTITCHVSPDAGWKTLEPFLKATTQSFVLGMYDFTAPHVYKTVRSVLRDSDITWAMTLGPNESLPGEDDVDSTKANDITEDDVVRGLARVAKTRFKSAFAHIGAGGTFASAYHIKVGVRDGSAFWLSSGNWQSSNQPDIDFFAEDADRQLIAKYNREWHVVVETEELARICETYLEGDLRTAAAEQEAGRIPETIAVLPELMIAEDALLAEERGGLNLQVFVPKRFVFTKQAPVRIQPILTPDNYIAIVRDLLRTPPRSTLYFQNQSLNPVKQPTAEFDELMQLLVDYSNDANLDVRFIFRNIGPVRKKLESLQAIGFNMKRIRMQAGCHTKGIIVDSDKVLLGSHNFTNDGVQYNRDASLLIYDAGIARYYQDIFLHDWDRLAKDTLRSEVAILTGGAESVPAGFVKVPWAYYDDEN